MDSVFGSTINVSVPRAMLRFYKNVLVPRTKLPNEQLCYTCDNWKHKEIYKKVHASENPSLTTNILSGNTDGYKREDVQKVRVGQFDNLEILNSNIVNWKI